MTTFGLLIVVVLGDAPARACKPEWRAQVDGCSYTVGTAPGATHGDTAVGPMKATAKASCGETVTVCGKRRLCVCTPQEKKNATPTR